MPSKPESGLYQRLKENLPACHITRIESRVNLGIPDCLVAFKVPGEFVMVELKVVRRGRKVALSPHQVSFHAKHADMKAEGVMSKAHMGRKPRKNGGGVFSTAASGTPRGKADHY